MSTAAWMIIAGQSEPQADDDRGHHRADDPRLHRRFAVEVEVPGAEQDRADHGAEQRPGPDGDVPPDVTPVEHFLADSGGDRKQIESPQLARRVREERAGGTDLAQHQIEPFRPGGDRAALEREQADDDARPAPSPIPSRAAEPVPNPSADPRASAARPQGEHQRGGYPLTRDRKEIGSRADPGYARRRGAGEPRIEPDSVENRRDESDEYEQDVVERGVRHGRLLSRHSQNADYSTMFEQCPPVVKRRRPG